MRRLRIFLRLLHYCQNHFLTLPSCLAHRGTDADNKYHPVIALAARLLEIMPINHVDLCFVTERGGTTPGEASMSRRDIGNGPTLSGGSMNVDTTLRGRSGFRMSSFVAPGDLYVYVPDICLGTPPPSAGTHSHLY